MHHHSHHNTFFTSRVENVRNMTQSAPPPQYCDVNVTQFSSFDSVTAADVTKLIHNEPNKQSWLDPLPMWLLKDCSDDLLSPSPSALCNTSLRSGVVLHHLRPVVTSLIKKSSMDYTRSQTCPSSQSCLNVLSALNYNRMSTPSLCCLQIN